MAYFLPKYNIGKSSSFGYIKNPVVLSATGDQWSPLLIFLSWSSLSSQHDCKLCLKTTTNWVISAPVPWNEELSSLPCCTGTTRWSWNSRLLYFYPQLLPILTILFISVVFTHLERRTWLVVNTAVHAHPRPPSLTPHDEWDCFTLPARAPLWGWLHEQALHKFIKTNYHRYLNQAFPLRGSVRDDAFSLTPTVCLLNGGFTPW